MEQLVNVCLNRLSIFSCVFKAVIAVDWPVVTGSSVASAVIKSVVVATVVTSVGTLLMFILQSTRILFVLPREETFHSKPAMLFGVDFRTFNRFEKAFEVIHM